MTNQIIRKCLDCGIEVEKGRRTRKQDRTKRCMSCYHKSRTTPINERFFKRVEKTETCWIWHGKKHYFGYGSFFIKKVNKNSIHIPAHRFSWIIHNGEIPDGLCVLHKCDNPPCVNPSHLFLGTHKDNSTDMIKKNRGIKTQFSNEQIENMVSAYKTGKFTYKSLANSLLIKNASTIFRAMKKYQAHQRHIPIPAPG